MTKNNGRAPLPIVPPRASRRRVLDGIFWKDGTPIFRRVDGSDESSPENIILAPDDMGAAIRKLFQ